MRSVSLELTENRLDVLAGPQAVYSKIRTAAEVETDFPASDGYPVRPLRISIGDIEIGIDRMFPLVLDLKVLGDRGLSSQLDLPFVERKMIGFSGV